MRDKHVTAFCGQFDLCNRWSSPSARWCAAATDRGPGNPLRVTLSPNEWMNLVRDFSGPPGIKSAVLAKGVREDNRFVPVDPTTDFPAGQEIYHAIITVKSLSQNTPVRAAWTAVNRPRFDEDAGVPWDR